MKRALDMIVFAGRKRHSYSAQRPWISRETLDLIEARDDVRIACNHGLETHLNKRIRQSAKRDRARWLYVIASSGPWHAIKQVRNNDHEP